MKRPQPRCETVLPWLKENLGPHALAPLTGTDAKALAAAVQIIELYAYSCNKGLLPAFGAVVATMQESCRGLAYHAIAHCMDWGHRREIWEAAGLRLDCWARCKFEP
jgi:hypothetical protein